MNKSEVIRTINRIERELPVANWHCAEIPLWPFIRFEVYGTNFNPTFAQRGLGGGWPNKLRGVARALNGWALASVSDFRATRPVVQEADAVFLVSSIGRYPLVEGRRYNPLLAPYVAQLHSLGLHSLVWEVAPFGPYNIPRYTPSALIQPAWIFSRALNSTRTHSNVAVHVPGHRDFLAILAAADLQTRYADLGAIQRDAVFVRTLGDKFLGWLARIKPRLGIVSDASLREQAFIFACRKLGITSVELQHGVQGRLHPAYGSWEAVPPEGYTTKPNIFWCWDAASADAINEWAVHTNGIHRAVVGGDAWREMWLEDRNLVVQPTDDLIRQAMTEGHAERHMLITLDTVGDLVPSPVLEMMRQAPSSWCFWLRIHPTDAALRLQVLERILTNERFRSMPARWVAELPLHGILRHVDAHLTASWSSVVLEASAFGVPSLACSAEASVVYQSEVARGMLSVVGSTAEMLAAMETLSTQPRRPSDGGSARPSIDVMRQIVSGRAS